jgi:hypothetical protein
MKQACWIVVLLFAACSEPEPVIPEERFVDALVALREAARETPGGDFAARRAEVLAEVGVTEEELRTFVREGTRYPRRLADAWDSAASRLGAPQAPDSVEGPE